MELWYFQRDAIKALYDYFACNTGNPLVAMPTGTGKSVVIGEFIRGILTNYPSQRVMMLTHVKELIEQNFKKLMYLWPTAPAGIYSAGVGRKDVGCAITYAGIATAAKCPKLFGHQDLLIIDECHLVSTEAETMYRAFIDALLVVNPQLKVIGLSATPYRMGLGLLTEGGLFTDICFDNTRMQDFNRLIEEGYLAPLVPRHTGTQLDTDNVALRGGEFVQQALQRAVDKKEVTRAALLETIKLAVDRKHWLIFASGVQHAEHIVTDLKELGVSACVVHSKMKPSQRDEAITGFMSGRYRALVNNNVLTTGFDFQAIDCIVVLRPTRSPGLWVQMLGRGTRVHPSKTDCLVLDFAGNTRRLGPINDPVLPRKKGEGVAGEAPVRLCEVCMTYNHASARTCFHCGFEFPFRVLIQASAGTEALIASLKPLIEDFTVDHVTYAPHYKQGSPTSLKASYYCGMRVFSEWICLEHDGFAGHKATKWWQAHALEPVPATVDAALLRLNDVLTPASIRVWLNKKYPEIMSIDDIPF